MLTRTGCKPRITRKSWPRSRRRGSSALVVLCLAGTAAAAPLLETHDETLTNYLPSANSAVQDVRPLVQQRGTYIDGSTRAGSAQGWSIGANPFEPNWASRSRLNGIDLATGAYHLIQTDVTLPGAIPMTIGRSYNGRQMDSVGGHFASDGYQGKNWFQLAQPEIVLYEDSASDEGDILYVIYGADRFLEFKRINASSNEFRGVNGAAGVVQFASGATGQPDTYTYFDPRGHEVTFFGFDGDASPAAGQWWKTENQMGDVLYAGHETMGSTAISDGYTADGHLEAVYDEYVDNGSAFPRRRLFAYTAVDGTKRLTKVSSSLLDGGTWASPSGLKAQTEVSYAYYVSSDTHGSSGDLKSSTITYGLLSDRPTETTYYRYYTGSYNAVSNPGYNSQLKMILSPEGVRRADWDPDDLFDGDHLTASDNDLKLYAAAYFEYDTDRRVAGFWMNGECGCGGGAANGLHAITYSDNASFSNTAGYDTAWKSRAIVECPDGTYITQYFDETGQPLSNVFTDDDPAGASPAPDRWVTEILRDSDGRVSSSRTPAANSAYTHSSGSISANASAGLVTFFDRVSAGDLAGLPLHSKYSEAGTSGTQYLSGTTEYNSQAITVGDGEVLYPYADSSWVYDEQTATAAGGGSGPSGAHETTMAVTFHAGSVVPKQITATLPAVSASANGSGSAPTRAQYLREDGRVRFVEDQLDRFTYHETVNGRVEKRIVDAQTNSASDFASGDDPNGTWSITESGDGERQVYNTIFNEVDAAPVESEAPNLANNSIACTYRSRLADGRRVELSFPRVNTSGTPTMYGPARYTVLNQAGQTEAVATVAINASGITTAESGWIDEGATDLKAALLVGSLSSLTVNTFDESGARMLSTRAYFDLSSFPGAEGTNYDETEYAYDDLGRRIRVKDPTGTISRSVYDDRGRVVETWIGTNDSSFAGGEPSGTDDMVKVSAVEYDGAAANGNGHVTKRTAYVEDSTTNQRVTTYINDARGRTIVAENPVAPHSVSRYDDRGRLIASATYDSVTGFTASTDPTATASGRLSLSESFFDERGQAWKQINHEVNQSTGALGNKLVTLRWFDESGRTIKEEGVDGIQKMVYDRLDRVTHNFSLAKTNDSTYAHAADVSGDHVLEESQSVYNDQNEMVLSAVIQREHDDTSSTGALDSNADGDDLALTAANLTGRVSITAFWHDDDNRATTTAFYGTNGGSTFDRDGLSAPTASSATVLVTETSYDTAGRVHERTDTAGVAMRTEYDDLNRRTRVIENYVDGTPGGGTDDDQDRVTRYEYTDGLQTAMIADMPGSQADQTTSYTYGVSKGASAGDSEIGNGRLLLEVEYPDSTGAGDVVTYAYNAQGQRIYMKDQAGNIIETTYDDAGRETSRAVTTLASGFDGDVRRIETTYTDRGQRERITQYDAASAGSVVDEALYAYDDWGNLTAFRQDHDSAVGGSGYYEVSYTYAEAHSVSGVTNGYRSLRRTGATLPGSNDLDYTYSSTGGLLDDDADRITTLTLGTTDVVDYAYLGQREVVGIDYPEPDVYRNMYNSSGAYDDYLDRFGRISRQSWVKDLATDHTWHQTDVTRDDRGSPTLIEDDVIKGYDIEYTYDDLNRLLQVEEGVWGGSSITTRTRQQIWELDQVGNWHKNRLDLDGDNVFTGTDELDELNPLTGTPHFNAANEWLARDTDADGTDDFTLSHDAVGNLTDDGESYDYVWDAFGRLKEIQNRSTSALVAEMTYNGLGYLIGVHYDVDADGTVESTTDDPWDRYVYDERWREVARFTGIDTDPTTLLVPHEGGLPDACVLLARDTDADGTLDERAYYLQNWRADVVGLVDDTGVLLERVRYSAYGTPTLLSRADITTTGSGNGIPDGDVNNSDFSEYVSLWSASDAAADVTTNGTNNGLPDGSVTLSDFTYWNALFGNEDVKTWGRGAISRSGSSRAHRGSLLPLEHLFQHISTRARWMRADHGKWMSRDPLMYIDGAHLYAALKQNPISRVDPSGLATLSCDELYSPGALGPPSTEGPYIDPPVRIRPNFVPGPAVINPQFCRWAACRNSAAPRHANRVAASKRSLNACIARQTNIYNILTSARAGSIGEACLVGAGLGACGGGLWGTFFGPPGALGGAAAGALTFGITFPVGVWLDQKRDDRDYKDDIQSCHDQHEERVRRFDLMLIGECGRQPDMFLPDPGDIIHPYDGYIDYDNP